MTSTIATTRAAASPPPSPARLAIARAALASAARPATQPLFVMTADEADFLPDTLRLANDIETLHGGTARVAFARDTDGRVRGLVIGYRPGAVPMGMRCSDGSEDDATDAEVAHLLSEVEAA